MDIGFFPKFDVDIVVVGSLGVGLMFDILLVVDLDVDSHLVDMTVADVADVAAAADTMVEDAIVVGIPIVDSLMLVIVDRIDRDSWFGGFDNWQLVMVDDIGQLDYVQMDYSPHRSDNEDEVMVDDAAKYTKKWFLF